MLYIVSTPIGNLEDISQRACRILAEVDIILAEDTRKSGLLLKKLSLGKKRFISFFEHNEDRRLKEAVDLLNQGFDLALITDAGTPCLSDPGYKLVRRCRKEKIPVTAVPGPSAVTNALVLSGYPTNSFFFAGFLPRKKGQRRKKLEQYRQYHTTLVLMESPYRAEKLLQDIREILPWSRVALVREMTKIHEEVIAGGADEVLEAIKDRKLKGEITLVLDLRPEKTKEEG